MHIGGADSGKRMRMFGMGSGLDIEDMVQQLMAAERMPLERLLQRRQLLEWRKDEYRQINSKLKSLSQAALPMRLSSTFTVRTVTSSRPELAVASATSTTPVGSYTLTVERLAQPSHMHSGGQITREGGSTTTLAEQFDLAAVGIDVDDPEARLAFRLGNGENAATFSFDPNEDSIYTVVKAINGSDQGLQASYDAGVDRFFLSTTGTGADVDITFVASDPDAGYPDPTAIMSLLQLQTVDGAVEGGVAYRGVNAAFTLNGASLEAASNHFTINQVTYDLRQAAPGSVITVSVAQDLDKAVDSIRSFIDSYNDLIRSVSDKLTEKRYLDFRPLTAVQKEEMTATEIEQWEEKARSGLLRADPLLKQVLVDVRGALAAPVQGTGSARYTMLAEIGIDTGHWTENGKLYIQDEAKLRAALANDPDAVVSLFTQPGESEASGGVGQRLNSVLREAAKRLGEYAGDLNMVVDRSQLGRQIGALDERVAVWESRLARKEEVYYRQYSLMESYLARMGAQAAWLSQNFGGGA